MAASQSATPVKLEKPSGPGSAKAKRWWPWLKRIGSAAFFIFLLALLVSQARHIEWHKVLAALKNYPVPAAWGAVLLSAASFFLYSSFDLLGRRYTGHKLGAGAVMATTFVGSLVGSVATRYRLYSQLGLETGVITRIVFFSMLTNWMGYLLIAGLLFSLQAPALPDSWKIDAGQLRFIGFALLSVAAAYLALCRFKRNRRLEIRGHAVHLPGVRLAALQLLMGAGNWLIMCGILYILLQHRIEFPLVASTLLLAAIAGVITHIPANLGVLEAVAAAMLSHKMPQHEVLAAIVAYRVVYYLGPLAVAAAVYLLMEAGIKKTLTNGR
jgi:glycosyltransferase 2 family protein